MKKILFVICFFIALTTSAQTEPGQDINFQSGLTPAQRVLSTRNTDTSMKPLLIHQQIGQSEKTKGGIWKGALVGGAIGVVSGLLTGFISGDDPADQWFAMTADEKAVGYGVIFGGAGGVGRRCDRITE